MKLSVLAILLVSTLSSVNALDYNGNGKRAIAIERDTIIKPGKDQITYQLTQIRDSIDNSVLDVQKKLSKKKVSDKGRLNKAYKDLTLQRAEIERVIEEVVVSNGRTWDINIQNRSMAQILERRREYHQILNDIKDIYTSESYQ